MPLISLHLNLFSLSEGLSLDWKYLWALNHVGYLWCSVIDLSYNKFDESSEPSTCRDNLYDPCVSYTFSYLLLCIYGSDDSMFGFLFLSETYSEALRSRILCKYLMSNKLLTIILWKWLVLSDTSFNYFRERGKCFSASPCSEGEYSLFAEFYPLI